jgi:peptidyl-prolyl cis-trans isomerase D
LAFAGCGWLQIDKEQLMLGTIREKIQGIFAVFVVGMLIIPFALWGINSYFTREKNPPVATVNGADIEKATFESMYRQQVDRLRGRIDPKLLSSGFLRNQVLSGLINQMVFDQYVNDAGYTVSNTQLDDLIRNQPEFKVNGKYSEQRFTSALRAAGLQIADYKRQMRYAKIQDQIISGYKLSAIVPKSDVDQLVALQQQQRRVAYLVLPPAAMRNEVKVSKEEIKSYYEANKARFHTDDLVRIEYAVLSLNDLIAKQNVSDKEAHDEYERNIDQYTTPAKRRVSHILVELHDDATEAEEKAAREKVAQIEKDLKGGMSFADAAKKFSQDPLTKNKGGDLGYVKPGELPSRDLDIAINNLKPEQVSKPVRSKFGFHILKLTAYTPAKVKPFSAVKKDIIQRLKIRRAETAYDDLHERFESLVYEHPDSLKPAADDIGVKIHTSEWLTRAGGSGLLANPDIIRAAFSQPVRQLKQNSDLIEAKRNTLVALRIKNDKPAAPRPLAQVSDRIKTILLQQKLLQKASEVGGALLTKAQSGQSLASLAQHQRGAKLEKAVWIKRADIEAGKKLKIDKQVAEAAFGAARPKDNKPVYGGVDLGNKGYAVFELDAIKAGDTGHLPAAEITQAQALLTERWGNGFYRDQLANMRQQADVEIHKEQVKTAEQ